MPLINEFHDSLPYIDDEPTAQARANIDKLISAEMDPNHQSSLHPSIPPLPEVHFSTLMQKELDQKEANLPLTGGIDLSRYEAPEAPEDTLASGKEPAQVLDSWQQTLRRAYTASTHLSTRQENLSLLDAHGKNAWLIGNSQLEEILRQIEKELQETKEATDAIHKARKMRQETAKGELVGLEDAWKRGVGGIIDVEVAAEKLRRDILEKRRQQSQGQVQQ
ncbi:BCAS2 family protein [Histoplasma capsulatum var. duboisii H88]|uniref:BCAS2 family protein n=2 Tax=Ajellomyces capsulatus TaxID=5037 RepID=F0U651_AJEC8|nr:BCAS2 family protein [Histoplasma capsulatum H143]EGC42234.1 BCAS2 family protein [Histoplasma capsulatum var. duboisii H88]QSS51350.1 BCAS2 family protein [Histoplasma capsulatum var. duboisii H88]